MPKRIQRQRTKGWRSPSGCIYVGRPTRWGNPFRVMGNNEYLYCDASHRRTILSPWVIFDHDQDLSKPATTEMAVEYYRRWIDGEFNEAGIVRPFLYDLNELREKDLSCWCGLDSPCHVDVLLELANR